MNKTFLKGALSAKTQTGTKCRKVVIMSNRTKVELASVKFQIDGKGKKLNFSFKSLGQKSLTEAIDYHAANWSKKGSKLHFTGKIAIGKVLNELTSDEKNAKQKGFIQRSLFPGLTPQEMTNFKAMYTLSTDEPNFITWKNISFPKLNSETAILQRFRLHKENLTVLEKSAFVDWINSDDEQTDDESYIPSSDVIKTNDHAIVETLINQFNESLKPKVDDDEPETDDDKLAETSTDLNTMTVDEFKDRFGKICNMAITMNNKELFDDDDKKAIYETMNNFYLELFPTVDDVKKAA